MFRMKRPTVVGFIGVFAIIAVALTTGGYLTAETPSGLRAFAGGPIAEPLSQQLPPVTRGPMNITPGPTDALSILSFDDGTCEAGLGAGVTVTDIVDFDVPTQCIQSGLDIVGLTSRMNSGTGTGFAFAQSGAIPPGAGLLVTTPLATALPPLGPCPATTLSSRAVGPGVAVITGTANFFAGLVTPNGYAGRDTNGPPAGRIWLNCATCGMTQYTPTTLTGLGLGGNWMIRVTVEDANCVPVELMELTVS